jgi:hypothetical protein
LYNEGAISFIAKNVGFSSVATPITGTVSQTTCSSTTPTFVNAASDDFHLDAADTTWIGAATNLYNDANYPFQTDIDGQDRGGAGHFWSIGADGGYEEITFVIDPDMGAGYNYDSLFDWEAARQGTLVVPEVAKCRCTGGTADTTAVTIDGWTTSATQYWKIWTDPAESYRHAGIPVDTGNKYRLKCTESSGHHIVLEENGWFDGIQFFSEKDSTADLSTIQFDADVAFNIKISNSIFKGLESANHSGWHEGLELYPNIGVGSKFYIWNCIFIDFFSTSAYESAAIAGGTYSTIYLYNCTIHNCAVGVSAGGATVYAKNVLTAATIYHGFITETGSMTCTNCASSDATADDFGGSGNRVSQTFTFVDAANDDFHLAANDAGALGYGLNLYNDANYPFQDDIDGQDRGGSGASWDIGADEYVSSATIEQEGFRFRNDDGSESAATWKANQDTNITLAVNTAFRLRELLNAIGDPASISAQLEVRYKPSGGAFGSYVKVVN